MTDETSRGLFDRLMREYGDEGRLLVPHNWSLYGLQTASSTPYAPTVPAVVRNSPSGSTEGLVERSLRDPTTSVDPPPKRAT